MMNFKFSLKLSIIVTFPVFLKLKNNEIGDKDAVFLTMEQFPLLKEDGPT